MLTDKNKHTFCPAKWQEVVFHPSRNLVFACCKSENYDGGTLDEQRDNLLNGVKDPSCNYCWDAEEKGGRSLRHEKLENWDGTIELKLLDIFINNVCNLQCTYCSPAASSKWSTDIEKNGQYPMYPLYNTVADKITNEQLVEYINDYSPANKITLIGGELLINPQTNLILNNIPAGIRIEVPSNMCYDKYDVLDKLSALTETNDVWVKPSIDTINNNVKQYIRRGFDPELAQTNIQYILEHTNINLCFMTLISPYTVWDLVETQRYIQDLEARYPNRVIWKLSYLHSPENQSFVILTDKERAQAIEVTKAAQLESTEKNKKLVAVVLNALSCSEFNPALRQEQQTFFKEFNRRHNVITPNELQFIIEETPC